jgi:methylmalonyl-CoA/ethylmalonyl-CoA epimerase
MDRAKWLSNVRQTCVVVKDLKQAMEHYHKKLGVGPFKGYTVDADDLPGITYRGEPANYRIQVGIAELGDWGFELLEHQRGDSIYKEYLEKQGEGLQHLGIVIDDPREYQAVFDELLKMGYKHLQGGPIVGKNRNGRFDYFDTERDFGTVLEILDFPEEAADPEFTYP